MRGIRRDSGCLKTRGELDHLHDLVRTIRVHNASPPHVDGLTQNHKSDAAFQIELNAHAILFVVEQNYWSVVFSCDARHE